MGPMSPSPESPQDPSAAEPFQEDWSTAVPPSASWDGTERPDPVENDGDYFASYDDPGVHRLMISDHARTDAYRMALEGLVEPGMRVLDIGTGTGILAMFAARAGAEVWAIDESAIIGIARELARANHLESRIHFIRDRAESIELPVQVDLLVSEWMGFFGLAECMFRSVIAARDVHLAPGGMMLPSDLRLYLAPVEDSQLHVERGTGLWERPVYGLDYSPLIDHELNNLITSAVDLPVSSLLAEGEVLLDLDLGRAEVDDFFYESEVGFTIERSGTLHGFGGWFEVGMGGICDLSAAPEALQTHWRQSFFPIRSQAVEAGDELRVEMRATPKEFGDKRLPLYFMDVVIERDDAEIHRAFYCHHGSFE